MFIYINSLFCIFWLDSGSKAADCICLIIPSEIVADKISFFLSLRKRPIYQNLLQYKESDLQIQKKNIK